MVKNKKVNGAHLALITLIAALIASTQPFFLWNVEIGYVIALSSLFFVLWDSNVFRKSQRLLSFILLFIFYFIAAVHTYKINIFGSVFYFIPLFFYFVKDEYWIYVYKKFLLFYTITLIPSLIVYYMVVWGEIDLPHTIIPPLNINKSHDYLAYPFLVIPDQLLSFRFSGYYDEPGVIGTISGTLFVVNKCQLKNWKDWILLISGIFSFSLFFYGLIILYVLLFGSFKYRLFLGIFLFISISLLIGTDNPFNNLIIERLDVDEGDNLSRLTRTDLFFDDFYKKFVHSDKFWYGYGNTYSETVANPSGASYKDLIVDFGIIMFFFYLIALFLYYLSFKLKLKTVLLLLMLMLANIYQRPFVFSLVYIFLLVLPPAIFKANEQCISNLSSSRVA